MKLYLATDALDDVRWASDRGIIDGVVLPDAALSATESDESALKWLAEFARAVVIPVFVSPRTSGDQASDAERTGRAGENVVVQLPFAEPYFPTMRTLGGSGVRIAATFVATAAQAMLAGRLGVSHIFVDVDRIDASGASGAQVIADARSMLDRGMAEADLVALFPAPGASLTACASAGADAAVIGTAALRAILAYPFTDASLLDGVRRPTPGERLRAATSA